MCELYTFERICQYLRFQRLRAPQPRRRRWFLAHASSFSASFADRVRRNVTELLIPASVFAMASIPRAVCVAIKTNAVRTMSRQLKLTSTYVAPGLRRFSQKEIDKDDEARVPNHRREGRAHGAEKLLSSKRRSAPEDMEEIPGGGVAANKLLRLRPDDPTAQPHTRRRRRSLGRRPGRGHRPRAAPAPSPANAR